MKVFASPWARNALGPEQMTLLIKGEPKDAHLQLTGGSPKGPWLARYRDGEVRTEARGADIVDTILEAFALANRAGLEPTVLA